MIDYHYCDDICRYHFLSLTDIFTYFFLYLIYKVIQIKLPGQSSFVPLDSWYPSVCVYSGWCSELAPFLAKAATEGWVNSWLLCPMCSSKIKSLLIYNMSSELGLLLSFPVTEILNLHHCQWITHFLMGNDLLNYHHVSGHVTERTWLILVCWICTQLIHLSTVKVW